MFSYNVNMMEEFRNKLPEELAFNILKYMVHPCAEMIKYKIGDDVYDRCACCKNIIFVRKHKHVMVFPDMKTFCELCYNNDDYKKEIRRAHKRYDIWAVNY